MKKYDLCVKSGTYTDRNGNEKVNWENVGVMMENDNEPYLLIKPWINFAGFPRDEGRSHLIVSVFEHKEIEQKNSRNSDREDFSSDVQSSEQSNSAQIPF